MIEAFTGLDESNYPAIFRKMYKQRYSIYVKRRKWKDLKPNRDLEKDQYDTKNAVYLLAMDERDEILGGLRLLPTDQPHILGDLFPHLAQNGKVPRGSDIYELTRFYVAPFGANRQQRDWLIGVLSAGMFEYCLEHGIRQVTSVIDTFLLPLMLSMEWPVKPLGLPGSYAEGTAIAIVTDVTERALATTRLTKGVDGPVLRSTAVFVPRIPSQLRETGFSAGGFMQ